jgi:hypothetical protein
VLSEGHFGIIEDRPGPRRALARREAVVAVNDARKRAMASKVSPALNARPGDRAVGADLQAQPTTVLDYKRFQANSAKLAAFCKKNKTNTLATAIKKSIT